MTITNDSFFQTRDFGELAKDMAVATTWLADMGYDYAKTRVGNYSKHLIEIAEYNKSGEMGKLLSKGNYFELITSLYEAQELVRIYQVFHAYDDSSLFKKLGYFIKGPRSYVDENPSTSSNLARNTAFELSLAAEMASAGFKIVITEDYDIGFEVDGKQIIIECKRPQVDHQVNGNIKGALRQLNSRYTDKKQRGLIALSIDRIINPDFKSLNVDFPEQLGERLSDIADSFIESNMRKWQYPQDTRTIGAIIQYGGPSIIKSEKLLTVFSNIIISNVINRPEEDRQLLKMLLERLSNKYTSKYGEKLRTIKREL